MVLGSCGYPGMDKASKNREAQIPAVIPLVKLPYQTNPFLNPNYLTNDDAEKILGEKATLTDSASIIKKDTLTYKATYTAQQKEQETGKTGVVYFIIEQYSQDASAQKAYNAIKTANENHEGVTILKDIGEDAYFHSDENHFYFILVRKGRVMFRIKVNKITSTTSREEFFLVAKKIAGNL